MEEVANRRPVAGFVVMMCNDGAEYIVEKLNNDKTYLMSVRAILILLITIRTRSLTTLLLRDSKISALDSTNRRHKNQILYGYRYRQ